jgi:hypothetical protein
MTSRREGNDEVKLWQAAELLDHRLPELLQYLGGPQWSEPEKEALAQVLSFILPIVARRKSAWQTLWQEEKQEARGLDAYMVVCAGCGTPIHSIDRTRIRVTVAPATIGKGDPQKTFMPAMVSTYGPAPVCFQCDMTLPKDSPLLQWVDGGQKVTGGKKR